MKKNNPLICYFSPQPVESELPDIFPNPFGSEVHPLVIAASKRIRQLVSERLPCFFNEENENRVNGTNSIKSGVMFGALVVDDGEGRIGFLSSYSGNHKSLSSLELFVPTLTVGNLTSEADESEFNDASLPNYKLYNTLGEKKLTTDLFDNPNSLSGIGDCASPRLLQFAYSRGYLPLAMAEFWIGPHPLNAIRHDGQFYSACRGKCWPILPFMLKGLNVSPLLIPGLEKTDSKLTSEKNAALLDIVYEDDLIVIVNKAAGLLSVPGKDVKDSVLTRLKYQYPFATGPLLVHRLDLSTSGLLLAAKDIDTHKALQQQFMSRTIEKRYIALLISAEEPAPSQHVFIGNHNTHFHKRSGTIDLPIRVDIEDRPRQLVCHLFGKKAITHWEIIRREDDMIRVYFYPVTGRTHQLRIHAAHKEGLNAAIVGDPLYGVSREVKASRLMLHAERLCFSHPVTGKRIIIESVAPF